MIEKHIVLEDIDPVIFYGVNNVNIKMIQALYPKLKIVHVEMSSKYWETKRKCVLLKRIYWHWKSIAPSITH